LSNSFQVAYNATSCIAFSFIIVTFCSHSVQLYLLNKSCSLLVAATFQMYSHCGSYFRRGISIC